MHGRVTGVSRNPLGDELTADAASGATTIYVDDGTDFDEDGGSVVINGTLYTYSSMDYIGDAADEGDPAVLYLPIGLVAAAAEGDRVDVWDDALGEVAVEYVATVVPDSAVPGDPLEAEVDHRLVPLLAEGIRAKGSESVELDRDGDDLRVKTILGKSPEVVDTVITGGVLRTAVEGSRVEIKQDASSGVVEFYADITDGEVPTPTFINPTIAAGRPSIEIVTGTTAMYDQPATLRMGSRYATGYVNGYIQLIAAASVSEDLDVYGALSAGAGITITFGGLDIQGGGLTVTGPVELNTLDGSGGLSYVMCGNDGVLSRGDSASDLNARLDAIEARLTAGGL